MDNCELGETNNTIKRAEFPVALGLVSLIKEGIRESPETETDNWGEEGQNV